MPRIESTRTVMASDETDCVVVGGGVIGLGVARALAMAGRETLVVEQQALIGTQTSSRHSEVIHAGIYYPTGSLKALLCVRGRELLYEFCAVHDIRHRRCGKLIVASSDEQRPELNKIKERAHANGVRDLCALSPAQAKELEPELECTAALLSPSTGIIDSHGLMTALLGEAERRGAVLAVGTEVTRLHRHGSGIELQLQGPDPLRLRAQWLINAAGHGAIPLTRTLAQFPPQWLPPRYLAKGSYFSLAYRAPFSRLIYPVPEPAGLGVHLTVDLAGQARFGPDVEWVSEIDYSMDARRGEKFYAAIRRYWPGLKDGALLPAYAGIRPKISGPNEPSADFRIDGPLQHGVAGLVNLFGIESPGLTASLAIAEHVAGIVNGSL